MSNLCHYYIIISKFYWIHSFNCYKNNLYILSLSLSLSLSTCDQDDQQQQTHGHRGIASKPMNLQPSSLAPGQTRCDIYLSGCVFFFPVDFGYILWNHGIMNFVGLILLVWWILCSWKFCVFKVLSPDSPPSKCMKNIFLMCTKSKSTVRILYTGIL